MAAAKNNDLKVKSILVTQPKPETDKSPYADLQKKYNLKIDFREFIHVEGVAAQDFRQQRVNIAEHTAVILTSRNAVDHFFRICGEMRVTVPDTMKYFCISESTAYYLQKYVQYRKRRIFHGKATINELIDIIKKHKDDKFLYPCTDVHKEDIPEILDKHKISYSKAVLYRTVCSDLVTLLKYSTMYWCSSVLRESLLCTRTFRSSSRTKRVSPRLVQQLQRQWKKPACASTFTHQKRERLL